MLVKLRAGGVVSVDAATETERGYLGYHRHLRRYPSSLTTKVVLNWDRRKVADRYYPGGV